VPVTWQQVLLEWQRDWKNRDTYDAVMELVKEHSGAMAWASTTPTPWCTRRLSAFSMAPPWRLSLLSEPSPAPALGLFTDVRRVRSGLIRINEPGLEPPGSPAPSAVRVRRSHPVTWIDGCV